MIRIWHDEAMRWMVFWSTITMLNTSVLLGIAFFKRAARHRDLQISTASLLAILWLAIAIYILFGQVRTRCHRIEMTLPISPTVLWRRHLAAVFLAGTIVLAGSLGVLSVHALMTSMVGGQRSFDLPYLSLTLPLLAGLLLVAAIVGSIEPSLQKLRCSGVQWAMILCSLVAIFLLLLLLIDWPLASTGICLAAALILSSRAERSLPTTFQLVPTAPTAAGTGTEVAASTNRPVSRWQIYRILFNVLHTAPPWKQLTPWMVYGFGALMGFVLAGGIERWAAIPYLRFLYIPFGSYMLFAGIGVLAYNLYRLDSLPLSRRTVLMVLTVPGLFFYCTGYAIGWWARTTSPNASPLVNFNVRQTRVELDLQEGVEARPRELRTMTWVEVDPSFMGATLSGDVPTLTSPWGESHLAWSEELFRGSKARLFNPYNTAEETSADFEALMLSRAIEDVYGSSISPAELRDRYFVVENNQVVGIQGSQESTADLGVIEPGGRSSSRPHEDYPQLEAPPPGPETPVYMLLVLAPWLLLTALFMRSFKANHSSKYIRGIYWAGLAIPMLGLLSQVFLEIFGLYSHAAGQGFLAIFIRSLGTSPGSWLLTWMVAVATILACYWLALSRFQGAEIPTTPINCSLVDWGKVD